MLIIGGTQGFQYNIDIYEFYIHKKNAVCKQLGQSEDLDGRYRHESFIHENAIYSLGGSNDQTYISFETVSKLIIHQKLLFLDHWLWFTNVQILSSRIATIQWNFISGAAQRTRIDQVWKQSVFIWGHSFSKSGRHSWEHIGRYLVFGFE